MEKSPLFAALLTPHRSINRSGILKIVAFYTIASAIPGVYFFMMGAWPVIGFLGLDVLGLWWALSVSLKSGDAFEEVTLWRDSLEVRHVYNPFWVRLHINKDFEDRVTRLGLQIRGEELEIGAFLNPDDKASFAVVFSQALSKARA